MLHSDVEKLHTAQDADAHFALFNVFFHRMKALELVEKNPFFKAVKAVAHTLLHPHFHVQFNINTNTHSRSSLCKANNRSTTLPGLSRLCMLTLGA